MAEQLVTTDRGIGIMAGEEIALVNQPYPDLGAALRDHISLRELLEDDVVARVPATSVGILAPIRRPQNIWAVGLNYPKHVAEISGMSTSEPFIFLKSGAAVVGPGDPIRIPRAADETVDYEGELAIVIGHRTYEVSAAEAWSHVAGLTICNDVSLRTLQLGGPSVRPNISLAKSLDTFAPLGPVITVPDSLPNRDCLHLRTFVNDELRQDSTTDQLVFAVPHLIEYLSARVTLLPGDVITTGTPDGVGAITGRYLRPGDEVSIELEGVGTLTNPVQASRD